MFIGSTEGNRFSGTLTASGRHTVQVYLMRNAARRNEVANYTINIGVTGAAAAAAAARPSHDALVAGTNYNATAEVPCITAANAPKGRCKAGVMRMAGAKRPWSSRRPTAASATSISRTAGPTVAMPMRR